MKTIKKVCWLMNEKNILNPMYKSGVKTLTDTQLKNGLPGFDLLKSKIETIRENAVNSHYFDNSGFENLKYDNILSIFGGRGAGKTSILFTLHHQLKNEMEQKNKINIIMPLIMPELIDSSDNFIGWILASAEKNLNEIEGYIKAYEYQGDSSEYGSICKKYNFFDRCSFNEQNELRKSFENLKKAYYAKSYNLRRGDLDYSADLELLSNVSTKSFGLIEKFTRYWNALSDTYRALFNNKNQNQFLQEPLIFFLIDDADLKPQIINELIFGLPKFFSHPNVVVIISASQKILNYTVKNFMFEQITGKKLPLMDLMNVEFNYNYSGKDEQELSRKIKFHELRYGREYDKIKNLTNEILRKLFPVSNRFYLKKYDRYEEKCYLKFEVDKDKTVNIGDRFAQMLLEFQNDIFELHNMHIDDASSNSSGNKKESLDASSNSSGNKKESLDASSNSSGNKKESLDTSSNSSGNKKEILERKKNNFTLLEKADDFIPKMGCNFYLSFLGKYPRDIVGGYYAFLDLLKELKVILNNFYINCESSGNKYKLEEALSEDFISQVYDACINFINSIITSNRNLKPFCRNSYELIFKRKMHWQLYVNYSKVIDVMCDPRFVTENITTPNYFAEMICLLNFVEQLIVLVIPNRMTSHGYTEFCQLLKKSKIHIIKRSDDLDNMFKQYYMFNSLNILQNFDKTKLESQDAFLDVVEKLDLAVISDGEMHFSDEVEHRKWYELLYEVMFFRFSNILQIRKYSNRLFVLSEQPFVDDKYDNLYSKFYNNLYERLYNLNFQSSINNNISSNLQSRFINVNEYILQLIENLNVLSLTMKIDQNTKTELYSLYEELDSYYMPFELKNACKNFIEHLEKNKFIISRPYLIQTLTRFENIIENGNDSEINAIQFSWLSRFKNFLKEKISLEKGNEYYQEYDSLCSKISKYTKQYINYLVNLYPLNKKVSSHVESVEKMRSNYVELQKRKHVKQYFDILYDNERRRLKGLEQDE